MKNGEKVKTLVVDQHLFIAEATKAILEEIQVIEVVDIATDEKQCMVKMDEYKPDLVIIDYLLPEKRGTEVIERIKREYSATKIVIFTGIEMNEIFNRMVDLEVDGLLSKGISAISMKNMIACILDGQTMLPISIFRHLSLNSRNRNKSYLTDEEILIMNMISKGYIQDQVAERISVSKRTVDNYLKRIYSKLDVKTRLEAIEKFIKSELYDERFNI